MSPFVRRVTKKKIPSVLISLKRMHNLFNFPYPHVVKRFITIAEIKSLLGKLYLIWSFVLFELLKKNI